MVDKELGIHFGVSRIVWHGLTALCCQLKRFYTIRFAAQIAILAYGRGLPNGPQIQTLLSHWTCVAETIWSCRPIGTHRYYLWVNIWLACRQRQCS